MNYSLLYFLFFAIQQSMNWPLLNYWGIRGPIRFWDANVVLTMSDCYLRVGLSVFNTFKGDTCTGYMYGSELLRTLSYLNIGVNNTYVIGWIFLTILALIFGFLTSLLNPPNFLTGFLISLIFISPPILLLVERGNFDSLIFILFFGAVISFKYWYSFPSFLIILLISTWKFYTLPLAALMLLKIKNPYLRIPGYGLFTFSLFQVLRDLQKIPNISVAEKSASFGSQIWGNYFNKLGLSMNTASSSILGMVILILCIVTLFILKTRFNTVADVFKDFGSVQGFSILLFQSSFLILMSCYLAGMNYDYRLIFLCTTSVGFLLLDGSLTRTRLSHNLVWILTIFSLWFSYNSGFLQPLGDFAILFLVCIFSIKFWKITFQDLFLASNVANQISKKVSRLRW